MSRHIIQYLEAQLRKLDPLIIIINPGVDVLSVPKPTAQQEVPSLKLAYSHQHASQELIKQGIYSGCRLLIPVLLAIAPVRKGNAADPVCPSPAIQPMQPVSSQRGRIRPHSFITMGYIGPSRAPMSETATAPPIRDGTNHTTSSRLVVIESAGDKASQTGQGENGPDSEEHINEYSKSLAYLWGYPSERQTSTRCSWKYLIIDP